VAYTRAQEDNPLAPAENADGDVNAADGDVNAAEIPEDMLDEEIPEDMIPGPDGLTERQEWVLRTFY
jgi:hypothetical protein